MLYKDEKDQAVRGEVEKCKREVAIDSGHSAPWDAGSDGQDIEAPPAAAGPSNVSPGK